MENLRNLFRLLFIFFVCMSSANCANRRIAPVATVKDGVSLSLSFDSTNSRFTLTVRNDTNAPIYVLDELRPTSRVRYDYGPTKIYVKPLLKLSSEVKVKAAVHITGDAYMKFNNLTTVSPGIGFEFNNFKPQPIFGLIQKTAAERGFTITDEEMFKTFNMGWGFGIIVDKTQIDKSMNTLEQACIKPEIIGKVTDKQTVEIICQDKKMVLT